MPVTDGTFSAETRGRSFVDESAYATRSDGTVQVHARDGELTMSLTFPDRPGTYSVGPHPLSFTGMYWDGEVLWIAQNYLGEGETRVESVTDDRVTGTFKFDASSLYPAPPDEIWVRDGEFDCPVR